MKKFLLLITAFATMGLTLSAQLSPGSTLPANITGTDYITGEAIDVQAWLDDGKTVVIDVFATWCGPCWTFHASGYLEEIYDVYGPEGTDQVRILGLEADGNTAPNLMETNQFGEPGNWLVNPETLENIHYNIMDEPTASTTLSISYYPSLYIIKPNGVLAELGTLSPNPRSNRPFWDAAIDPTADPYLLTSADIALESFCDEANVDAQEISFINPSDTPITSAEFVVIANGELIETVPFQGSIGAFQSGSVQISAQTFTENTELQVGLSSVNGTPIAQPIYSGTAEKYSVGTRTMNVRFTTDNWPIETSWRMTDETGAELFAVSSYIGLATGGGADALRTFEYQVTVPETSTCLTFAIADSYGDGLTVWNPAEHYPPGIEVQDNQGNWVKQNSVPDPTDIPSIVSEGTFFFNAAFVNVSAEGATSVEEITTIEDVQIFPNPVTNELTLDLATSISTDYSVSVIDAMGQTVQTLGNYNSSLTKAFDVSELPTGIYFLRVATEEANNLYKFSKI